MAQANVTTSSFLSVNWRDAFRGFLIAFLTVFIASIGATLDSGSLPSLEQLETSALFGLAAGLSYVLKNVFSPSEVAIKNVSKETIKAVQSGQATISINPSSPTTV